MTGEHAGMRKIEHYLSDKQADCSKWIAPLDNMKVFVFDFDETFT